MWPGTNDNIDFTCESGIKERRFLFEVVFDVCENHIEDLANIINKIIEELNSAD